jgi:hypothetical protein
MSRKILLRLVRFRWLLTVISVMSLVFVIAVLLYKQSPSQQAEINSAVTESVSNTSSQPESARFVGSQTCGECHAREWTEWQSNPMYLSMTEISSRLADEDFAAAEFSPLSHVSYRVERRDFAVFHHERMTDKSLETIYDQSEEVTYVVGSGQQGHAYFIKRPGMLFTSPINWYSRTQHWDLAPGYNPAGHQRFERRVTDACLNCHAGRIADDPQAKDRFLEPAFPELSIGCERCHGAGEQHVAHHRSSTVADLIVNPAKLDPAKRDSVCAQCHLQGVERVLRPGRTDFDFRPGQLVGDIWTIYVDQSSDADGTTRAVSHVEQMQSSQCYTGSDGQMSCTTCHDPHSAQHGTQSANLYRTKCLTCHNQESCATPAADRAFKGDSCIACHMSAISASDVPHAVHTNHRILRRPQPESAVSIANGSDLTIFQDGLVPLSDAERKRSLGMTLARLVERGSISASSVKAEQLLRQARSHFPGDPDLLECLGTALTRQGRSYEAAAVWRQGLQHDPQNEALLYRLAQLSHDNGAFEEAATYIERFLNINPWHAGMYGRHAHVMGMLGRYPEGIRSAEKALELDPSLVQVHGWLIDVYQMSGQSEASLKQQQIYMRLTEVTQPPDAKP